MTIQTALRRAPLALAPLLLACSDAAGPTDGRAVAVRFTLADGVSARRAGDAPAPLLSRVAGSAVRSDAAPTAGAVTIAGSNGTLVLDDVRVVIAELELERVDGTCPDDSTATAPRDDDDDCESFEGGPFVVSLLDGSAPAVVTALVPPGRYESFEFETADLDEDEDDDDRDPAAMRAALAELRQAYPAFPRGATMVVRGTFAPTGGVAAPFTVYFDAELEVEAEFATPFRVPEDGALTVALDPSRWFAADGRVLDLRALDGRTIEFGAQFRRGVVDVDRDDD